MNKGHIELFAPAQPIADARVGVVLVNHAGSTAKNTLFTRGDTVGDATYLADTLGVTVIAADRPGSGTSMPNPLQKNRLNTDASAEFEQVHTDLWAVIAAKGLQRIIITGRSLGGYGALALGTFGADEVVAFEPGAMHHQDVKSGKKYYKDYLESEKKLFADQANDYILPPQNDQHGLANIRRALTIAKGVVADTYHYTGLLATDEGLQNARCIARNYPETPLSLYFAEKSLVYPTGDIASLETELKNQRAASVSAIKAPVVARAIPNTLHGSFNNRALVAQYLEPSVANQSDAINSVS